jgi:adenine-specific DNA-methyltransferase
MEKNIYEIVEEKLRENNEYVSDDGNLLKAKIYADTMSMNSDLIKTLLSNKEIKKVFFSSVEDIEVFDKQKFAWFIESKEFLPDSYTKYTNTVGLTHNDKYLEKIDDVVLDFPYKDCILEGGQTKENQKRNEIFYNEIIGHNQITNMLSPKVFTNSKRYSSKGIEKDITLRNDDNLVIKGNNLISISSLLPKYEGKIKLIYIDPPYNTGSDSFSYNDNFNRSSWLVFMKNRLEVAKRLLSNDGAIYVQADYHQAHYCKVLMDEIFGEANFQREIIWRIGWLSGYKTLEQNWIRNHDTILFYSKDYTKLNFNKEYIQNDDFKELINSADLYSKIKDYKINGNSLSTKDAKMVAKDMANYINHENRTDKYPIEDIWNGNEYDDLNSIAIVSFSGETVSKMLDKEDEVKGQKSEKLLERIINAHTKEGDIVLDFFGGTGTTGAVAMKMNRKFILCEQLDKHIDICQRRLEKVMDGEQSGISKKYNWNGGGSFVYCELKENSEDLITAIQKANDKEITKLKNELYDDNRIVPYITKQELKNTDEMFNSLELDDKKKALINLVDKNKLYVNYSDINDADYKINDSDKKFTNSFYNGGQDE